jgi:shikimate dehydrogenase
MPISPAARLGVLGWPVAHSRSPAMHNAALQHVGLLDWRYQPLPVPPELFDETVRALPAAGFRGANVTIPHKEAALTVSTAPTPRAAAIGAANTLTFSEGAIEADNTDAPALIEALPFGATGKTAVVLGAGGSARAAVWALLDAGGGEVRVWNRTPERARRLCDQLGAIAIDRAVPADILVNCTSVGLDEGDPTFKQLPVSADDLGRYECVVDLVYTPRDTLLIRAARERGVPTVDGLELLVRQGALSFERFTGRPAPLDVMRSAVAR